MIVLEDNFTNYLIIIIILICLPVYDVCGTHLDSNVVILNDIHIDIMDYIVPAQCTDSDFRNMWAEFEWENKISVVTRITNLNLYLEYLLKNTNMRCLTSEKVVFLRLVFDHFLSLKNYNLVKKIIIRYIFKKLLKLGQ